MNFNGNKSNSVKNGKKLKMAILGFGLFAEKSLLNGFKKSENAELVAITKRKREDARTKAEQYNIPYYYDYSRIDELFSNNEIDAIFVATPNSFHKKDTIKCLNAGKDVLLEKPMALNAAECELMISTAKKNERQLMIAHCMRYLDVVEDFKKNLEKGLIGEPVSVTADFYSNGFASSRPWKFDKSLAGGGAAFDLGVHMIDTIRFILSDFTNTINNVKVSVRSGSTWNPPKEVDLVSTFLLEFENNIIGRTTSSFLGSRNTFLEVFGTEGYFRAYEFNHFNEDIRVETFIDGELSSKDFKIRNNDCYTKEIDAFASAILEGRNVPIPGEEGLINQKIIDLVNSS